MIRKENTNTLFVCAYCMYLIALMFGKCAWVFHMGAVGTVDF